MENSSNDTNIQNARQRQGCGDRGRDKECCINKFDFAQIIVVSLNIDLLIQLSLELYTHISEY